MHQIEVDPSALDAAHRQILLSAGRISGLLDDLAGYLSALQATWSGSAAAAAQAVTTQWAANAAILEHLLTQLGGALDGVGENYTAVEAGNAHIWVV